MMKQCVEFVDCITVDKKSKSSSARLFGTRCIFMLDYDECAYNRTICQPNALRCNNTEGSYVCLCQPGYENKNASNKCTGARVADNPNESSSIRALVRV